MAAEDVSELNFNEFKEKVDESAKYIIFNMRDHIFKENYILSIFCLNLDS